jgi:hypothetical protein
VEKTTTNREVIKISHVNNIDKSDSESPDQAMTTNDFHNKLTKDMFNFQDLKSHSNALNTPLAQEYSTSDQEKMIELKLFSQEDSYKPSQTVYFSNKILQKYIKYLIIL